MATGGWWTLPLPPGWEAKYDANQQRYFFINHQTRQTTWEDPRQTVWKQQQEQQQRGQLVPQAWPKQPSPQPVRQASPARSPARQPEQIPMREMKKKQSVSWQEEVENKYDITVFGSDQESDFEFPIHEDDTVDQRALRRLKDKFPTVTEDEIKKVFSDMMGSEGLTERELERRAESQVSPTDITSNAMALKLQWDFPTVDLGTVRDMLRNCQNDEAKTRTNLKNMGFNEVPHSSSVSSASSSTDTRSNSVSPNPSASPNRSASPARSSPVISESRKATLKAEMTKEFPSCSKTVIEMALDSCNFDEAKTRILLKSMAPDPEPKQQNGKRGSSPAKNNSKPSQQNTRSSVSPARPVRPTSMTKSKGPSPARAQARSEARPGPKPTAAPAKRSSVSPPKQPEPQKSPFKSEYTTKTKGHNDTLVQGLREDNLLDNYVNARGPNKGLRSGPCAEYRCGSTGGSGPDKGLAKGPDKALAQGRQPDLAHGSMYRPSLITAL